MLAVSRQLREKPAPDVLRELMNQHGLTQKNQPAIGAQSVVSAVLNGKHTLNVRQIGRLAVHFNLPADAFMP